ncbi:MAG TPA: heme exporter protein CcmD [Rhizomicrobium sp.]|nr:heme exporter protein CcmD [Rhizomicrobium sp.]
MSPYAFYVWTAYGVSFAGIAAAIVLTVAARRRARVRLDALEPPR